jgi:hypothetical protein
VKGSPCLRCQVYDGMKKRSAWVRPEDLAHGVEGGPTGWIRATMSSTARSIAGHVPRLTR